ncbi:MAG TPA: dihydroorotate dehydrogenase electron transfer subunit [Sedimentisphaerales bacterium]|nr:dihydroorotate dehydrogenase electron transfer subunit [Sedimentisphaerales bacterium]
MTVPEVFLSPIRVAKVPAKRKKGPFEGEVVANTPLSSCHWRLSLRLSGPAAKAFAATIPGQFAQFDIMDAALPPASTIPPAFQDASERKLILRRPLSFAGIDVSRSGDVILDVLYCVLGPGTLRMTTLAAGDSLSIIGPLGNGYTVPKCAKLALLVAGGMGAPPLQHMAQWLRQTRPKMDVMAFVGARSREQLPYTIKRRGKSLSVVEFDRYNIPTLVATDDGSLGYKGFVTGLLAKWLGKLATPAADVIIHTCGPEAMMKAVAAIAENHGIACQASMERMMACGIGLCQSCAVECHGGADTEYRLCCKDGPVFDAKDVVWETAE